VLYSRVRGIGPIISITDSVISFTSVNVGGGDIQQIVGGGHELGGENVPSKPQRCHVLKWVNTFGVAVCS
jgi:hypothetical protein